MGQEYKQLVFTAVLVCQLGIVHGMMRGDNFNHGDSNHHDPCAHHHCHHGLCVPNGHGNGHECICDYGYMGENCDEFIPTDPPTPSPTSTTTSTSTQVPTTASSTSTRVPTTASSTSTRVPTTTTMSSTTRVPVTTPTTVATPQIHAITCGKFDTVIELANQIIAYNKSAAQCPSGNHSSPEAFVLRNCRLSLPAFWKKGPNVAKFCQSLPTYTPVAMFGAAGYLSSYGTISGILMGCLTNPTGFKVAIQRCDSVPTIVHLVEGGQTDIHAFNVIVY